MSRKLNRKNPAANETSNSYEKHIPATMLAAAQLAK